MNRLSATNASQDRSASETKSEVAELPEPLATHLTLAPSAAVPADSVPNEIAEQIRLEKVLEEARIATGATGAAIGLLRGSGMVCCATTGPHAPEIGAPLDAATGLSGCCIQTGQLQQCSDTETDARVNREACRYLGVRSIVVLPLVDSGQLVGIFEVLSSQPAAFSERHLDDLKTLANQILESNVSQVKADATAPEEDVAAPSMKAEVMAREAFLASAQREAAAPRRNKWMVAQIAAIIALAVLLGWMLGRAGWKMAVGRAESQLSGSPEAPPTAQVSPDAIPVASDIDKSGTAPMETKSSGQHDPGTVQVEESHESDVANVPNQISLKASNSYVLERVKPEYPKEAKQHHIQGRVVLRVLVGTDGLVRDLTITSGDPELIGSATDAVRKWRFKPQRVKGQPVEFETQITVKFALT